MMSESQTDTLNTLAQLVGQQIRAAREALNLSQEQLAQQVAIPRTALSAVEHGKRQVSTPELLRFAEALHRPFDYFLRKPEAAFSFQPLLRVQPVEQDQAEQAAVRATLVRFEEVCRGYAELEELNQLPIPTLPTTALDPTAHSGRDAEALAEWVRSQLGLGQTVPAVQLRGCLEERFGVKTFVLRSASKLSGASIFHPRIGGCVLVIARSPEHMLFTLAHELAHLLVHRDSPSVDEDLFARSPKEQFANAFAAALLMPRTTVHDLFTSLYRSRQELTAVEVAHLARHFGTSYSAMVWRLQGLRLIGSVQREALLRRPQTPHATITAARWPAMPERSLFLAARAYHQESVTLGWLREVLRDEQGNPIPREELQQLLDTYQTPAQDWPAQPLIDEEVP